MHQAVNRRHKQGRGNYGEGLGQPNHRYLSDGTPADLHGILWGKTQVGRIRRLLAAVRLAGILIQFVQIQRLFVISIHYVWMQGRNLRLVGSLLRSHSVITSGATAIPSRVSDKGAAAALANKPGPAATPFRVAVR